MKKALACSCAYCSHQCGLHQPIWAVQTAEEEQDLLKQCCCQPGAHRHVSCHCSVPLCVCVYTHGVYMWYMGVYTWSVSVGMCVYTCRVCVCVCAVYMCVCARVRHSHTQESLMTVADPQVCSPRLGWLTFLFFNHRDASPQHGMLFTTKDNVCVILCTVYVKNE